MHAQTIILFIAVAFTIISITASLELSAYKQASYKVHTISNNEDLRMHRSQRHTYYIAMNLRNTDEMHNELMEISNPRSSKYGKQLSVDEIAVKYGPSKEAIDEVKDFLSGDGTSQVEFTIANEMIKVTSSVGYIEDHYKTELRFHSLDSTNSHTYKPVRALRAVKDITVPQKLHRYISFISLNNPINSLKDASSIRIDDAVDAANAPGAVSLKGLGSSEVAFNFIPTCLDSTGATVINPNDCTLYASISVHANNVTNPDYLYTYASMYPVTFNTVNCANCSTTGDSTDTCICTATIINLPKYEQLKITVHSKYVNTTSSADAIVLGSLPLVALTDTATPQMLKELYNVPSNLAVKFASNQSVVEFYGQYYSNDDLSKFLLSVGMAKAYIPTENVYGDANVETDPGGEAQLDVEYIMAMAINADTYAYIYSPSVLNPYDSDNEGFLTYLYTVGNQTYPPLVHSLSYGDVEAQVYATPASSNYASRCDQQFLLMGLRGLTVLFSR